MLHGLYIIFQSNALTLNQILCSDVFVLFIIYKCIVWGITLCTDDSVDAEGLITLPDIKKSNARV